MQNEYRCTRRALYKTEGCPGHTNLSARQGYYIRADSKEEALRTMAQDFPKDVEGFDVQAIDEDGCLYEV